jgi:hypothetical protein
MFTSVSSMMGLLYAWCLQWGHKKIKGEKHNNCEIIDVTLNTPTEVS